MNKCTKYNAEFMTLEAPLSVPKIEGGSPERHGGEEEGLVLEYSSSWMCAEKRNDTQLVQKVCCIHVDMSMPSFNSEPVCFFGSYPGSGGSTRRLDRG